ncbi:hypothetical protein [Microbacterium sp. M4A5_1d]
MARTTRAAAAAESTGEQKPAEPTTDDSAATTTLDADTTKPSVTAPGDGPADTTDPTEIAVSTPPNPGKEAVAVGTVNAVTPAPKPAARASRKKERTEEYEAYKPDGTSVTVVRNIETGESRIK